MLSLKQIFFFILGINCLFLLAFFVSVRTPGTSFTANTNAFETGLLNSKEIKTDAFLSAVSDEVTTGNTKKETPKDEPPKEEPPKVEPPKEEPPKAEPPKAEPPKEEPVKKDDLKQEAPKEDTPKNEPTKDVVTRNPPPAQVRRNPRRSYLDREDAAIETISRIIETAREELGKAEQKNGELLRRRNKVQNVLRWNNPFFLMGAYGKVLKKYFNSYPDGRPYYMKYNYGLINDPDYCELVDSYNLAHPENMFKTMNFFTDYAKNGLVRRDVIRQIGEDKMHRISRYMPRDKFFSAQYHLDPTITTFFTKRVDIHIYHMLGKNFNCATQMYNHIPGHGTLKRKDLIVDSVDSYARMYEDQGVPQCFNKHTFFPFSYRLYIKEECQRFFRKINSQAYKESLIEEPIQYLVKLGFGAHRANGVFLLDKNYTIYMNELYEDGDLCGESTESVIAQTYVTNPLLLDKSNKFDFRVYMLVASTNPLIVYYHDGFLRVSLEEYNKNSEDRNVHLTNTHLSKDAFAEAEKTNKTKAQELRDYQMWTFERLEKYLLESKKISNTKWLDEYLRPAFKQAFIHTTRMSAYAFWNASNVYEMFGLDFMLDDQMNLWFIECNSSPQLIGTNEHKTQFLIKMLTDLFEIQYGYYRSRMKRVLNLIKKMNADMFDNQEADYSKYKEEYKEAVKNRFEDEYKISKDNSFELIMDLNLEGPAAYFDNIPDECAN